MYEYKGKSVFGGIAIGRIKVYSKEQQQVKRMHIDDCESEKQRYINAVDKAVEQLGMLYDKALKEVGEANAAIFEMHQIMLEDDDYKESVLNIIDNQNVNAEYAVAQTSDNFSSMFAAMDYHDSTNAHRYDFLSSVFILSNSITPLGGCWSHARHPNR